MVKHLTISDRKRRIGAAPVGDRDRWGTYQGKNLSQWAHFKSLKHAWAENEHEVVPLVSDTESMSGESAALLCLFGVRQSAGWSCD